MTGGRRSAPAIVLGLLFSVGVMGCGTVGPPIPPEDIGLAKRLAAERDKAAKAKEAADEEPARPEDQPDDVNQPLVIPR